MIILVIFTFYTQIKTFRFLILIIIQLLQNLYVKILVFYLHGDIEKEAENEILRMHEAKTLKSDILKVAHHGSKSSTTDKFLEVVSPKIALIGVRKR